MAEGIQNPQLREILERWLIAALPYLRSIGDRSSTGLPSDRTWMSVMIFSVARGSKALPQTEELLDAITQAPEFVSQDGRTVAGGEREVQVAVLGAKSVVGEFALQYLRASTSDEFEPELFAVLYEELETFLYQFDDIPIRIIIELWNVEAESTPISLGSGVVIRPLTKGEKAKSQEESFKSRRFLFPSVRFPSVRDAGQTPTPNLLIELERNAGGLIQREITKPYVVTIGAISLATEVGRRVLLALRLLYDVDAWLGFRWTILGNRFLEPDSLTDMSRGGFRRRSDYGRYFSDQTERVDPPAYQLPTDQVDRLSNVYSFLESDDQARKKLDLPLRRFEMSLDRDRSVDGFIDLWIVLEGLFSPEGGGESSFRMQQSIAQFLGQDARARWDIYCKAKESYQARNAILHGRRFLTPEELQEHAVPTQTYARRSLLKSIEGNKAPSRKELEREIFLQGIPIEPE